MPSTFATADPAVPLAPLQWPVPLSVGIVSHFSDKAVLRNTLESLCRAVHLAQQEGCLGETRILLVDNSGQADEAHQLSTMLNACATDTISVRYVGNVPNEGYGTANNQAIREASAGLHLILNPDVELKIDALSNAIRALCEYSDCVLLTPRATDRQGAPQHVAKGMPGVITLFARALPGVSPALRDGLGNARYELRDVLVDKPMRGDYLAGGCFMLCRSDALRAVDGFDERFFMYFEDFDLSLRLSAGKQRVLYAPTVQIIHEGGQAARKGRRHILWFARSALRFFSRHGWRWSA